MDIIRQVKEAVSIPVIGNGAVFTPEAAKRMVEETGCDGIMVARGAKGNPWIFREIAEYLETGRKPPRPSSDELKVMILRHGQIRRRRRLGRLHEKEAVGADVPDHRRSSCP